MTVEDEQPSPSAKRVYPERNLMMGPVRLYRDDLIRIGELLRQYPEDDMFGGVSYKTQRHAARDLPALLDAEDGPAIRRLAAHRHRNPRIMFLVTERYTHLSLDENRPEWRGPFEELVELFESRRRRLMALWLGSWPLLLAAAVGAAAAALAAVQDTDSFSVALAGLAVGGVTAAVGTWVNNRLTRRRGGWSLLHLTTRAETSGFWSRHGEGLVVEAMKLSGAAFVGWLIGRLT